MVSVFFNMTLSGGNLKNFLESIVTGQEFATLRKRFDKTQKEMAQLLVSSISKKARLKYNFCSDLPCIEADSTQIRQVVMNLIVNASEALEDREGTIEISTGVVDCSREELDGMYLGETLDDGNYVYLCVKDDGCGMDESTLNRIFDPFFSTKFTGRGLGLAAALRIVRGHQ